MDARTGLRRVLLAAALGAAGSAGAAQMDIETFNNLRRGMLESEVLLRAGAPDLITAPGGYVASYGLAGTTLAYAGARVEFHYLPDANDHDPWLTVVVLSGGRISALERTKFTGTFAASYDTPDAAPTRVQPRDHDIRADRADRTLRAAERYAEVRWRIRERGAAADGPAAPPRTLYRGTDDQGTPYFGDVAPRHGAVVAD